MNEEHWGFDHDPLNHDNEYPSNGYEYGQKMVTCNRCEEHGLHWENFGGPWRLFDRHDDPHLCQAVEPTADDFDDIT